MRSFKQKRIHVLIGYALSVGAFTLTSSAALAQQQVERVTVTGSAIKRVESEGALPVQIMSRSDIDQSGAKSVTELIQSLPSIQGFTQASESVGGGGGGFSGASIHNIGETRTLVLLNGRRVATWAGQTLTGAGAGIDLNSLPLSAVERVEVLTDGASALYGSDAVAGVINFILKSNMTEAIVYLNKSIPKGGVGKQTNFALTKGWGDLQSDGYNTMLSYSKDKQDSMRAADRGFAKSGIIDFNYGGQHYRFSNTSWRGVPANYEYVDQATGGGAYDVTGNMYYNANGKCPPQHVYAPGGGFPSCQFDYTSTIQIQPNFERENFLASFSKKLGQDHTFGTDIVWSKFTLTSRIAPPPVDMTVGTGSVLYNKYLTVIPGITNGDDLYAYWRGMDAGNRATQDETTALHAAFSLKGTLGAWDYSTAYTHSTNKWIESYVGGWLMQNEQDAATAAGSFDPFLEFGQQTAAGQTAIAGMQFHGEYKRETSTLDALELRGSREAFKIGDQTALLGAGVDYHKENVKYEPSNLARGIGNNIAGDSASEVPFDVSRNSWGAFAELVTPFSKQFEITTALRHDNYSDFGSSDNYKLAARFQPTRTFLVRGSIGSGFRAPSVPQVAAGRQQYGVSGGTYDCPAAALTAAQAIDPTVVCRRAGSQYDIFASGNSNLKPEKSEQWTLGFRAEPVEWASIGADLWNVEVKDRINQLSEDVVMADPAKYLKNFTTFNDPGTGRRYLAIYLPNENLGKEKYSGIDVDGKLMFNTGIGKLTTTVHWTHMLKYDYQRIKDGPYFSNLGVFNDDAVTFKDIVRITVGLKQGSFQHSLTLNHKSSYQDQPQSVQVINADGSTGATLDDFSHKVDAFNTFDWQTQYHGIKSLTLTAGIMNLQNRNPPLSLKNTGGHQLGYDNRYADPSGRTLYLNASYKF